MRRHAKRTLAKCQDEMAAAECRELFAVLDEPFAVCAGGVFYLTKEYLWMVSLVITIFPVT